MHIENHGRPLTKLGPAIQAAIDLMGRRTLGYAIGAKQEQIEAWLANEAIPTPDQIRSLDDAVNGGGYGMARLGEVMHGGEPTTEDEGERLQRAQDLLNEALDEELPGGMRQHRYPPTPLEFLGVNMRQQMMNGLLNGVMRRVQGYPGDVQQKILSQFITILNETPNE